MNANRRRDELVVATYNIHRCIGMDKRYDPGRIREVLHHIDADIIALQEVERFRDEPDLLPFLCEGSDWQAHHGITMERESGKYGNALLTRLPIMELSRQSLPSGHHEPRGAIHALLRHRNQSVRVICTHLGLHPSERRQQVRALIKEHEAYEKARSAEELPILLGDFNEWAFRRRSLRGLQGTFTSAKAPATWPSRRPILALDRIFSSTDFQPIEVKVINTPLTRIASDHLPLRARFILN